MSDCCQPGTPAPEEVSECCEVPKTPQGWTDNEVFYYQFGGHMIRGVGTASSIISQQDATDKAKEAARQNAILKAGCGTPPIGGTQLFCQW
jgi:hypothetical protein